MVLNMDGYLAPNKYILGEILGRGASATVYKVVDKDDQKFYAMKILVCNEEPLGEELQILKMANNENIIKMICCEMSLEYPFYHLIMEYCENKSLRYQIEKKIEAKENFDLTKVFEWIKSIINGLCYLHFELNVIHRDIKPENILLTIDDKIKICDFGVAVILTETSNTPTIRQGTIYYMSPEMDNPPYDSKTDIWSSGCLLFELITLKRFKEFEQNAESFPITIDKRIEILLRMMLVRDAQCRINSKKLINIIDLIQKEIDRFEINCRDLYDKLQKSNLPQRALNLPARILDFFGRENEINSIEDLKKSHKIIVINSQSPGNGKKSLAIEYSYRFIEKEDRNCVSWFDKTFDHNKLILTLCDCINFNKYSFMLIFDDLNHDLNNYLRFIPKNTFVLLTTKLAIQNVSIPFEEVNLDSFNFEQSVEFAKRSLGDRVKDENDVKELINLIGDDLIKPRTLRRVISQVQTKTEIKSLKKLVKEYRNKKSNDIIQILIEELSINDVKENKLKRLISS